MHQFFALVLLLCCSLAHAADPVLWRYHVTDFANTLNDKHASGRVCSHPLVAGDRCLVLGADGATVISLDLLSGVEVNRYAVPLTRSTIQMTNAGTSDSDLVTGVYWSLVPGSKVLAAVGGDMPQRLCFDLATGAPATINLGPTVIGAGANCATAFTSSAGVPFVAAAGNNNHSNISLNGSIHDLRTGRAAPWTGYKQWCVGLAHDGTQAAYRLDSMSRTLLGVFGTRVWGISAIHGGVGCELLNEVVLNSTGNDGRGFPKPAAVLADGRVVVLTSNVSTGQLSLWVVNHTPTPNKIGIIKGFTTWKALDAVQIPLNRKLNQSLFPQLVVSGTSVAVVFAPSSLPAWLAKVDCDARSVVWSREVKSSDFAILAAEYSGRNFPLHARQSAAILGDQLRLHSLADDGTLQVHRWSFADGAVLGKLALAVDLPKVPDVLVNAFTNAKFTNSTVQSIQSTQAGTLLSLYYRSGGKSHQSFMMIGP